MYVFIIMVSDEVRIKDNNIRSLKDIEMAELLEDTMQGLEVIHTSSHCKWGSYGLECDSALDRSLMKDG